MCKNLAKFTKATFHAIELNIKHDFNSHNRRKSNQANFLKTCKQFFYKTQAEKKVVKHKEGEFNYHKNTRD